VKVILLDDHEMYRDSMRIALRQEGSIEVVAGMGSVEELRPALAATAPDLLIVDLMLRDSYGLTAVRDLAASGSQVPAMVLSAFDDEMFVREAFDAGVRGYALKAQPLSEVIDGMRRCVAGERYVFPRFGAVPASTPGEGPRAGIDHLSPREREVFAHILDGRTTRDIADLLSISLKTVETHRSHINRKLAVHSPGALLRLAALKGMLRPPDAKPAR
jgi:DNA-binding NarL/FixJ family response regulator